MAFRRPPHPYIEIRYLSGGCINRIEVEKNFKIKRFISDYLVFKLQI